METLSCSLAVVGLASRPMPGQTVSGDLHVVAPLRNGLLVAAIDGLGHGSEAEAAAGAAAESVLACASEAVVSIVRHCHERLRKTRGAVMSLASFNALDDTMTWLAVGNVEAYLLRADASMRDRPHILMRGGVVGHALPPLRAETLGLRHCDTLVMGTDGIRNGFSGSLESAASPQEIADSVMARFGKENDDALVLAVRWTGREQ